MVTASVDKATAPTTNAWNLLSSISKHSVCAVSEELQNSLLTLVKD